MCLSARWKGKRVVADQSDGRTTKPISDESVCDDGGPALTEVYRGENPEVDIVAVHGVDGDTFSTFSNRSGKKRFWLGDLDMLPKDVRNSRILTYRYPGTVKSVHSPAQTLIAELVADRELEQAHERPIIFICHSLGGIVVKRALVYSASRTDRNGSHLRSIYTSTYSILFFGTPHYGGNDLRLVRLVQQIRRLIPSKLKHRRHVDTQSQLVVALMKGSEILQGTTDNFTPLMKNFKIFFFWEQDKTNWGYTFDYVVHEGSAAPILDNTERAGIRADHRSMCKFASRNARGYRMVASSLVRYARDAPATISRRWNIEKERVQSLRHQEMKQLREELGAGLERPEQVEQVEQSERVERVERVERPARPKRVERPLRLEPPKPPKPPVRFEPVQEVNEMREKSNTTALKRPHAARRSLKRAMNLKSSHQEHPEGIQQNVLVNS